ncbi:MAG: ATP-binding cassette domain-containing protein [Bacillota bacterium]
MNIENLIVKNDKNIVLKDVNFKLNKGDSLALVGKNGSGKTSLLTTLIKNKELDNKNIGYIPQEIALFNYLTVFDNFKIFGKVKEKSTFKENNIVKKLDLERHLNMKISKLSGGTKRRVNIGVELIRDPDYILMDEPIVGIDYNIRKKIISLINQLKKEGKIFLIASHNISFLQQTCNKLLVFENSNQSYFGDYSHEAF